MALPWIHTNRLHRVATYVLSRSWDGDIGAGRAPLLHSLEQLREPHPQPVVSEQWTEFWMFSMQTNNNLQQKINRVSVSQTDFWLLKISCNGSVLSARGSM